MKMETMEQKKMVSVSAFAKMAGKTKAEVYSLIAREENKKFVSTENGMKMVDVGLLDVLNGKKAKTDDTTPPEDNQPVEAEGQPHSEEQEQPKRPYKETPIEEYDEGDIDENDPDEYDGAEYRQRYLVEQCKEQSAMIRHLLGELRKADQKIAERDETIHRLSLELAEMATKSHTITEQALQTVNQQQILTAMAQKKTPWYKRLLGAGKTERNENNR